MKKILIIGTIDETHRNISGQYDRTEIIKDGLHRIGYPVKFVNMIHWKKHPLKVLGEIVRGYHLADAVIFLASLNGTRVILNILSVVGVKKKKPVYQIAVGGQSNYKFVKESKWYRNKVGALSAVFVELESMVEDYKSIGVNNVHYLPNCKTVMIDKTVLDNASLQVPFRFCTYSRVTPEKGIAEAIGAVENINDEFGIKYCTLDIYGTYLEEDKKWFDEIMAKASSIIKFKGRIERKDSISTLSQYDLLLFPTQHTGEGVPGGLIDCYEAGLPIITCNTSYMTKIVHDGMTGFIYEKGDQKSLIKVIKKYTMEIGTEERKKMRARCQDEALKYDTSSVVKTLSVFLEN